MSATYKIALYELINEIEKKHFWFQARNVLLQKLIIRYIPKPKEVSFLEVGFGTGAVIGLLEKMGFRVTGIDINKKALMYARKQCRAPLFQSSIFTFTSKKRFAAVGAFDVMEHIFADVKFLKHIHKLLAPAGLLFLTVPAHRWLWSKLDTLSGHQHRYSIKELEEKLKRSGFSLVFWNYWQAVTLPIFWLWRKIMIQEKQETIENYLAAPPALINKLLYFILLFEQMFFFRIKFPIGGSIVICAKRGHN